MIGTFWNVITTTDSSSPLSIHIEANYWVLDFLNIVQINKFNELNLWMWQCNKFFLKILQFLCDKTNSQPSSEYCNESWKWMLCHTYLPTLVKRKKKYFLISCNSTGTRCLQEVLLCSSLFQICLSLVFNHKWNFS